eukprot:scaffold66087_cov31-Tisochrysis_lutea.AAC.1
MQRPFVRNAISVKVVPHEPGAPLWRCAILQSGEARPPSGFASRQIDEKRNESIAGLPRFLRKANISRREPVKVWAILLARKVVHHLHRLRMLRCEAAQIRSPLYSSLNNNVAVGGNLARMGRSCIRQLRLAAVAGMVHDARSMQRRACQLNDVPRHARVRAEPRHPDNTAAPNHRAVGPAIRPVHPIPALRAVRDQAQIGRCASYTHLKLEQLAQLRLFEPHERL